MILTSRTMVGVGLVTGGISAHWQEALFQ